MNNYSLFQNSKDIRVSQKIANNLHVEITPLTEIYFSPHNSDTIQNMLVQEIKKNGYDIGKQSARELEIVMRSIYLQNPLDSNLSITQQVLILNKFVIQECVPKIITQIKQYIGYMESINSRVNLLEYPKASIGKQSITHPYLRNF